MIMSDDATIPLFEHNKSGFENVKDKPATLEEWKEKAETLWQLLDDIDTYGDMYKPKIDGYFKAVNKKASERHKVLYSDGYKLINR